MASTLETCANTAARPASPAAGDTIYQIDTKQIITYDGATWRLYDSTGAAVNDADITALSPHLWLDPTHPSAFFTDAAQGTGVTADGSRVGCFADRSGNDFDFVQATETNKPILCTEAGVGGVPSLCYSKSDELGFVGTSGSEVTAANITIFWVWRLATEGNHWFLQGTSNTNEPRLRNNGALGAVHYNWSPFGSEETSGTGGVTVTTSVVSDASFAARHIYCLKTNSSANRTYNYQNGGADIAGSTTAPTGVYLEESETIKMFAGNLNHFSPHWLFEYIVFDTSLSDANVNTVNTYLGNKHGITVADVS